MMLIFSLKNFLVTWLRIYPSGNPGTVQLYKLVVKRKLAADIVFTASDIYNSFKPGHEGMSMTLGKGFVEITSVTGKLLFY